jgi:FkbM family methyltransferase
LSLRGLGVLNFKGFKESGENFLIKKLASDFHNVKVIDVGANKGSFSKAILKYDKDATIYAFEPHPLTFQKLEENAKQYGFYAYNVGCGNMNKETEIFDYFNKEGSPHASLYRKVIEETHNSKSHSHRVKIIKLDDFIEEAKIQEVSLLKIDTEGHDLKVIEGALRAIHEKKIDIILFEFNEMNVISRTFLRDFYQILPGFNFFRLLRDGFFPLGKYKPLLYEIFAYQNIVAVRKGSSFSKTVFVYKK